MYLSIITTIQSTSHALLCLYAYPPYRLHAALTIRSLVAQGEGCEQIYVLVVEHDLAVLDYLSDYICCLYGTPSAYGVVTMPFSVREGINIFLAGFVPTENLRFREEALVFKVRKQEISGRSCHVERLMIHGVFFFSSFSSTS